jgi:ABC-type Zn uptake system ZnuABC Zn-binding protein ZnuA
MGMYVGGLKERILELEIIIRDKQTYTKELEEKNKELEEKNKELGEKIWELETKELILQHPPNAHLCKAMETAYEWRKKYNSQVRENGDLHKKITEQLDKLEEAKNEVRFQVGRWEEFVQNVENVETIISPVGKLLMGRIQFEEKYYNEKWKMVEEEYKNNMQVIKREWEEIEREKRKIYMFLEDGMQSVRNV